MAQRELRHVVALADEPDPARAAARSDDLLRKVPAHGGKEWSLSGLGR